MKQMYLDNADALYENINNRKVVFSLGANLDTKTFRRSLRAIDPYVDLLEGERTLKDMAEYGYDKNDYQAMRIFRYNLMKNSLRVNIKLDMLIVLMNIISFYLLIVFGGLNINFFYKTFSWMANKPIDQIAFFKVPVLSNINFFIGFSVLYFSIILIELFKNNLANFTKSEFYYGDTSLFFTKGQLGLHTILILSCLFDLLSNNNIESKIHLQRFNLIHTIIAISGAIALTVIIHRYLENLKSMFSKIKNIIDENGFTKPTPLTEELLQKHKHMVYSDKNIQIQKTISSLKSSGTSNIKRRFNIVEITPDNIVRKRQQEIQKEDFQGRDKSHKQPENTNTEANASEESKVININKVKRRARI